jgi:hypothetical protein
MTISRNFHPPHHHVKYSWLNRIVKRIVKIDPNIGKIKWFADFVLALMTTWSKSNQFTSLSCYLEATDSLPFKIYMLLAKNSVFLFERLIIDFIY